MSDDTAIPSDLVASARALGQDTLELVVLAYQRARSAERRHTVDQAIAACEREGLNRAEHFVDLSPDEMAALEARLGAMSPSPVVAAFYEGVAEAVEACCARIRTLEEAPAAPH